MLEVEQDQLPLIRPADAPIHRVPAESDQLTLGLVHHCLAEADAVQPGDQCPGHRHQVFKPLRVVQRNIHQHRGEPFTGVLHPWRIVPRVDGAVAMTSAFNRRDTILRAGSRAVRSDASFGLMR